MARDIRQRALERIAALSATKTSTDFDKSDLDRLCKAAPSHGSARSKENSNGARGVFTGAGRVPMVANSKFLPLVLTLPQRFD
jgi:phosphatidylinositol 4-kinase